MPATSHADLLSALQHEFKNEELLLRALTHKSFYHENTKKTEDHNERLEFLGDSVLDLALCDLLMEQLPDLAEGDLSKVRASLVNENALAEVAQEIQLEKYILLGKGERLSGGGTKPRLLASALEALLGAIYRDSDFVKVSQIIRTLFLPRIQGLDLNIHFKNDYKTRLQEKLQGSMKQIPVYVLDREDGPAHNRVFYVSVLVGDKKVAEGAGRSKKQAEQEAAKLALSSLEEAL